MKQNIFKTVVLMLLAVAPLHAEPADSTNAVAPVNGKAPVESTDSLLARAARFYQQNEFAKALEQYKTIEAAGYVSATLLYDMGNASFKQHDIKSAILYYERARRLAPNDEDINNNLSLCRSLTFDKVEAVPELFLITWGKNLRDLCSERAWSWISIWCFVMMLVCGLGFLFVRKLRLKRTAFWVGALLLALSIATFVMGGLQHANVMRTDEAIVFTPSVTVKSSPDDSGNNLFIIHEGLKVTITDQIGEWCEIRIADGHKGWMRVKDLKVI